MDTAILFPFLFFNIQLSNVQSSDQFQIRYAITENQPHDMRIGRLAEDLLQMQEVRESALIDYIKADKFGLLKYHLREPSKFFRLHEITSTLTSIVSIDLEELCPKFCKDGAARAQLTLVVNVIHENQIVAVVFVEVTVLDVDDNPPKFPPTVSRPFLLQLKEVIYRKGQQVELPKAIDKDVQKDHTEISYRLEQHDQDTSDSLSAFELNVRNDSRLMLTLLQDMDYEKIKSYRFYLVAWSTSLERKEQKIYLSAPQPHFTDRLEIIVEILNINDIEPVFSKPLYSLNVSEGVKVGTNIFTLEAIDGDQNSTITYSLEGDQEISLNIPFQVKSNGHVLIAHPLDYEQRADYHFTVRASDGEFYTLTRLQLTVTDVNDEAPEFFTSPSRLQIEENVPGQTKVGQLFVIDRDTPNVNGQVTCHEPSNVITQQPLIFVPDLSDSTFTGHQMTSTSGTIEHQVYLRYSLYTRHTFDRETSSHIQKSVLVCTDGQGGFASTPQTATLTVSLTVRDQNDNPPLFDMTVYESELEENCQIGTRVIQVHASDMDTEPHAKPRYQLLDHDLFGNHFSVDPESGWIYTKANIDRETQPLFQLTVLAVDGHLDSRTKIDNEHLAPLSPPTTQHTSSAQVNIRINDLNDNAPEFRGPRQFAVEENQSISQWIGDLHVLDRDEGLNREVVFEIPNQRLGGRMKVQDGSANITTHLPIRLEANGSLYTSAILDRENQSHYCFEVVVKDKSPIAPLSSADTICVRVLDLNDNAPEIFRIQGTEADNETDASAVNLNSGNPIVLIRISVNEAPGYCALIVEAQDADEGRNALLRYTFNLTEDFGHEKTLPADTFLMDSQSGRLMLSRNLHFGDIGVHGLTINVEDSGVPTLKTEKLIHIAIEDKAARGNWLLPEIERTRNDDIRFGGQINETHTILIVIGLAGISAFLAAALISAILCMIKPCRKVNRTRRSAVNKNKLARTEFDYFQSNATTKGSIQSDRACKEYTFSVLNGNGYIETIDENVEPGRRAIPISTVSGLEHLFIPSDKVIGVETLPNKSCSFETNSATIGHYSPTVIAISPNSWISSQQEFWTPIPSNTVANIPFSCIECPTLYNPISTENCNPGSQSTVFLSNQEYRQLNFSPTLNMHANPVEINGERLVGSAEEQRSDSGRGASDEEVPSISFSTMAAPLGKRKQFNSVTLRSNQDRYPSTVQRIIFPSLPRPDGSFNDNRLTTFESGRGNTPGKPNIVRIPEQIIQEIQRPDC